MTVRLNPPIIGQVENAHRALLERILAGTGRTYQQWVALVIAGAGAPELSREQLIPRVGGALRVDEGAAQAVVGELTDAQLLGSGDGSEVGLTTAGQELHSRVRSAIDQTVAPLYTGIPEADLETAGRVLAEITARADKQLARDQHDDVPDRAD